MFFFDTMPTVSHTSSSSQREVTHGNRENPFLPNSWTFCRVYEFQTMRPTIQRSLQGQKLFLLGSIPLHGLCSTNVSRKSPRYRGLSAFGPAETLSHGLSRKGLPQYPGSRQPGPGLANLCRLRPNPHWSSSSPLRQRFLRSLLVGWGQVYFLDITVIISV